MGRAAGNAVTVRGALALVMLLAASEATAATPSGGPPKIEVMPPFLVIGTGKLATVRVTAAEDVDVVHIGVNVGRIVGLRALGPGRLEARYEPPVEPFPQVALIAAVAGDRAAVLPFPLHGKGVTEVDTGRRTEVTLHVAGREFGPRVTDDSGKVTFEITVPPGVRTGYAISVDRYGHSSSRDVDLAPPEFPRLLVMTGEPTLRGDGVEVPVFAFTLSDDSALSSAAPPAYVTAEGELSVPRPVALGVWRSTWKLTAGDGARSVALSASLGVEPLRTVTEARVLIPAASPESAPAVAIPADPAPPSLPAPVAVRNWRLLASVAPAVSANLAGFVAGGAVLGAGLRVPGLAGALDLLIRGAVLGSAARGVGQIGNTLVDVNVRTVVAPLWLEVVGRLPAARVRRRFVPEIHVGGGLAWVHRRFRTPLQPASGHMEVTPAVLVGAGIGVAVGPGTLAARLRYGYANPVGETPNVLGLVGEVGYRLEL